MVWHWRVVVGVFHPMGLSPRDWLHRLHVTRALVMVSVPPLAYGVMWSGSGLVGWRLVSHVSVHPQSGQLVCPAAWAKWRTRVRHFLWRVVPVRDALMVVLLRMLGFVSVAIVPAEGLLLLRRHRGCLVSS